MVDLRKQGSFGFLGFDFRRIRSLKGVWRPQYTPKLKKRTAVLAKLRDIFRRHASQPVERVIERINPVLRGWVNYFAVGHSGRCFTSSVRLAVVDLNWHEARNGGCSEGTPTA